MKHLPLEQIDPNPGPVSTSQKSGNEMRLIDLIQGVLVMGSFVAFSLVSWYMLLKLLNVF